MILCIVIVIWGYFLYFVVKIRGLFYTLGSSAFSDSTASVVSAIISFTSIPFFSRMRLKTVPPINPASKPPAAANAREITTVPGALNANGARSPGIGECGTPPLRYLQVRRQRNSNNR